MAVPDVAGLVDSIRAEVDARRARGDFRPEDFEVIVEASLERCLAEARIDPRLATRFRQDGLHWNIDAGYPIRARPGAAGFVLRLAKRLVRPFVRLYTDHLIGRQAQINLVLWRLAKDQARRAALLEIEARQLRAEIDALKRRG